MPEISSETKVTMTMTQLVLAVFCLLGGGWGIFQLTTSGVRDDVSVIRQAVQALQLADKDGTRRVGDTELKLTSEIGLLRTAIVQLDGKLSPFVARLDTFDKTLSEIGGQLADMRKQLVSRQAVWSDPKNVDAFSYSLQKAGFQKDQIVIVPFDGLGTNPIKLQ
jgi:septal ring factor EnvC (AmiA/AmiB activator)